MNTNTEWLESLSEGDVVAVLYGNLTTLGKISRATKNFVTIEGTRYRRKDGYQAGSDVWSLAKISQATDSIRKEVRERQIRNRFIALANRKVCEQLPIQWLETAIAEMEKANRRANQ